mgnify:CR=1 FL=1
MTLDPEIDGTIVVLIGVISFASGDGAASPSVFNRVTKKRSLLSKLPNMLLIIIPPSLIKGVKSVLVTGIEGGYCSEIIYPYKHRLQSTRIKINFIASI